MILSTTARCYMSMTQFCPPILPPIFFFVGGGVSEVGTHAGSIPTARRGGRESE